MSNSHSQIIPLKVGQNSDDKENVNDNTLSRGGFSIEEKIPSHLIPFAFKITKILLDNNLHSPGE
ncbi:hypothetical protein IJ00_14515 [Calothrix sp. 336/3]|nr:hypothetical protein IJ00_14515 [Calothrix sp. 336/3]